MAEVADIDLSRLEYPPGYAAASRYQFTSQPVSTVTKVRLFSSPIRTTDTHVDDEDDDRRNTRLAMVFLRKPIRDRARRIANARRIARNDQPGTVIDRDSALTMPTSLRDSTNLRTHTRWHLEFSYFSEISLFPTERAS